MPADIYFGNELMFFNKLLDRILTRLAPAVRRKLSAELFLSKHPIR